MSAAHRCHVADCMAMATDRCFECGAWCCDEHRSAIQIPTYTEPFREYLCDTCLLLHRATPDRYGSIVVEQLTASTTSRSAEGEVELGL
jgi:hypothetical protein